MLINYSTTDLNIFLSKAEQKLVTYGELLVQQVNWDEVEDSLLNKIELLTFILDEIDRTVDQEQIDKLVYFALDYFNLHEIPYSPFSIMPMTIIGTGGSGGSIAWEDILDKPETFVPSPHNHNDEDILIDISGITETIGGITPGSFTGTLEEFLELMLIKFQAPKFSNFKQNSNGLAQTNTVFEIGQTVNSASLTLSWNLSNLNVKDASNSGSVSVSELDPFTDNQPFNLKVFSTGKVLHFGTMYTKTIPGTLQLTLNGIDSQNIAMMAPQCNLEWKSKIWYGNHVNPTLTVPQIEGFSSVLTSTKNGVTVTILGAGYKYVFIPNNIDQTGIQFMDGQFTVDMEAPVAATIFNTFGVELEGMLYRTTNFLNGNLTILIL